MYNTKRPPKRTTLYVYKITEGETIEMKMRRILKNKEPIKDGAPIIYTERSEGVLPQYDIRTDRMELALEATDKIARAHIAQRQSPEKDLGTQAKENMDKESQGKTSIGGPEPTQATDQKT